MKETTKHEAHDLPELEGAQGGGITFIPLVGFQPRRTDTATGNAIMDNLNDDLRDVLG